MRSFLKYVLATIVGVFLTIFLMFVFFAGVGSRSSTPKISTNSILKLDIVGDLPDMSVDNPFSNISPLSGGFNSESVIGLKDIKMILNKAAEDDKIKAIWLNTDELAAMPANLMELVRSIEQFKANSGKLVYAYSNNMSERSLLVNSVADKSYLNPMGYIEFNGMASEIMYFTGLLEKLKVKPEIFYAGEFKSATEPFRLKSMSPENRLQVETYLNSIYSNYLNKLSALRKIPTDSLDAIATHLDAFLAVDAEKYKLVDGLKYEDEIESELKQKFGYEKDEDLKLVSLKNFQSTIDVQKEESKVKSNNKIAVIYAEGEIVDGKGTVPGNIHGSEYQKLIRKVREDKDVKAIVLRVNSPGGSAFASEQILRELKLAQEKIPVVVSMGNLAASGGYYISSSANKIVAEPTSITGSIGVFGMMFNIDEALKSNLGITFDRVKTNPYADFGSPTRPWDDKEKSLMTRSIQTIYQNFLKHVSEGRKMSIEDVDKVARGRVWTGQDALQLGLVDTLGNMDVAISIAQKLADVETYKVVSYPEVKSTFDILMETFTGNEEDAVDNVLYKTFGEDYLYLKQINSLRNMQGAQTRLPYMIRFR